MSFYVEDGDLDLVPGEKCRYCGERPAKREFRFYPAHYFCSMECKVAWYTSPDDEPKKAAAPDRRAGEGE